MIEPMYMRSTVLVALLVMSAGCGDDGNDTIDLVDAPTESALVSTSTIPQGDEPVVATADPDGPIPEVVAASGVEVNVIAIDNIFRPERVEVRVGDDVVWENRGMNEHNILSIEGPAPGSPVGESESIGWFKDADDRLTWGVTTTDFQPGNVFTYRFSKPGEYRYYCAIHGTATVGMIGVVVVTE